MQFCILWRLVELVITHILYKRGFDFVQVLVQVFILNFGLLIAKVLVVFCFYLRLNLAVSSNTAEIKRHRKYHAKEMIYLKLNVHNYTVHASFYWVWSVFKTDSALILSHIA